MKRFLYLFSVLAVFLSFAACSDEYRDEGYLLLSSEQCVFDTPAGSQRIGVATTGAFEVSPPEAPWCSVTAGTAQITVSVEANPSTESRTTRFTVTAPRAGAPIEVTVTQAPADRALLELSEKSDRYTFDATGGSYRITVMTASAWKAETDSDYYTLKVDPKSATVTLTAPENSDEENHPATLTVTAGEGATAVAQSIAVTQLTKAESPYYRFTGRWDMYCSRWRIDGADITDGGTYTSCTIEPLLPGESYLIKGLFYSDAETDVHTMIPATFDRETGRMEITVGNEVGLVYIVYPFYLMMARQQPSSLLYDQLLRCSLSDDLQTITIDGFLEGYGWGCFPYVSGSGYMIVDKMMPYAFADDCYFRRSEGGTAPQRADARIRRGSAAAPRAADSATFKPASL